MFEDSLVDPGTAVEACVASNSRPGPLDRTGLHPAWPCRNRTIHELFEEQAATRPETIAVVTPDSQLTYGQLNERANRLAQRLIKLGVKRGDLVALCMERSADVMIGLLGILKAGGAYVPLDSAYPDERLAFMLADTAARCVVAHKATAARLAPFSGSTKILCLDGSAAEIVAEPNQLPKVGSRAEDCAYVIFTSGSTGNPKGVLVGHRAVVRLVRDTNYCQFTPDEVFIHIAPLAFDASTFEIWGPLLNGGRLVVLPPFPLTPDALAMAIHQYGVTTLWITIGLFNLVAEHRVDVFRNLRQVISGGDVMSPSHVSRAMNVMEHGVFFSAYGPTENTTYSTCYPMRKGHKLGSTVPIGKPIANTTVFVLDERMRQVPTGEPGELYVGGDGVAEGYLNNPELTREKFVPNPFGPGRLYRTGDRACFLPDGNLEFLGRIDNQVKIMGHRIEPGEIEAVLRQHAAVGQVIVVARRMPRGDKQLAAYVIPAQAGEFSAAELKRYLAERLPPHMIPARIAQVDDFPLNQNGKVDRAQLAAIDPAPAQLAGPGSAGTELERKIVALWSRILGCQVGLDENFFDAGGTSLHLLEVNAELSKLLGKPLGWTELFEHPTVRSLAARLSGAKEPNGAIDKVQERARLQKASFGRQKLAKGTRP
jgi:amino acid adenylation domain-containing protein